MGESCPPRNLPGTTGNIGHDMQALGPHVLGVVSGCLGKKKEPGQRLHPDQTLRELDGDSSGARGKADH